MNASVESLWWVQPISSTSNPERLGDCLHCGYPVYKGLAHICSTAPLPADHAAQITDHE